MKTMGVWNARISYRKVWKLCVCVWKSSFGIESIDTWFRTLYLGYGLGWELPNSFRVSVELRRALRLLYMCFGKGLVAS